MTEHEHQQTKHGTTSVAVYINNYTSKCSSNNLNTSNIH